MYVGRDFDPMDVGEVDVFTLDFVKDVNVGETLVTASFTCEVLRGVDASPGSRLSGSAVISGTKVSQTIAGTLDGVVYRLIATAATNANRTIKLWSHFPSRDPD